MAGCQLLNEAGKVSSDKRDEMVLVTDVLGVESLVGTFYSADGMINMMSLTFRAWRCRHARSSTLRYLH